ncbi:acetate--CoA ligase family protein [Lutimaribacter sp. EGI FJ00015]|uniref:Acetate--CoA ligase family protein n=1 Tax=Lutimaribacter degradans TaxID=2945989 RepID=A0ACC5ZTP2_9RHOB|nr:acetate--CoA ligase family protein [Lutimaribacter sp. EGI FJ00013]MCM2561662.1 acetate--CoA ligase family protein [Lutimaribacter sp. EGI FJ00013]MCO0612626.1 acetate--CoA ligase family protein [Lutimaribacter sp. EGI FJ00015]MCO0635284.1 acetate--CoA ligase family protein [Lutimaribacter sp. EGI FJ00014]
MEISLIETVTRAAEAAREAGASAISEGEAKALLRAAGIPAPHGQRLRHAEDVTDTSLAGLRPPMVAKVLTRDGAHKSDFGGVRLGLQSTDEVREAIAGIADAAKRTGVPVDGFLVEEQSAPGLEMVLGGFWDARLGPCVMIGLGGVFVEIFEDVAFRACPITEADARSMIDGLRAAALLRGARGMAAHDEDAVISALLALGGRDGLMSALDGQATAIDINPLIVHADGAIAVDARILLAPAPSQPVPEAPPVDCEQVNKTFRPLFMPRSIAVLGASASGTSFGNEVIRHSLAYGFKGRVQPVHPKAAEVEGFAAVPTLADLPEPVDFAYVAVAAEAAIDAISGAPGSARFVQVMSSGFGEAEDGHTREDRLLEAARASDMRLIGPNCLGVHSPRGGLTFVGGSTPEPGGVAVISQSGGLAVDVILRGETRGLRYSAVTTLGNSADLGPADLLEYHLCDPDTKVIGLYIEDVRDGRRFVTRLRQAGARKPVVLLLGGRTAEGRRAAASHTGALAGEARLWDGIAQQTGMVITETLDDFLDTLLICQAEVERPARPLRRVALFGNGGGTSVLAADAFSRASLTTPEVPQPALQQLETLGLPPGTGLSNPVDTPAGTLRHRDGAVAGEILDILAGAGAYDAIVVHVNLPVFTSSANQSVDVIGGLVREAVRVSALADAPRIVLVLRSDGAEATDARQRRDSERARQAGLAVFAELPQAARALGALSSWVGFRHSRGQGEND